MLDLKSGDSQYTPKWCNDVNVIDIFSETDSAHDGDRRSAGVGSDLRGKWGNGCTSGYTPKGCGGKLGKVAAGRGMTG